MRRRTIIFPQFPFFFWLLLSEADIPVFLSKSRQLWRTISSSLSKQNEESSSINNRPVNLFSNSIQMGDTRRFFQILNDSSRKLLRICRDW